MSSSTSMVSSMQVPILRATDNICFTAAQMVIKEEVEEEYGYSSSDDSDDYYDSDGY